jgi:hypothetical protein
MWDATSFHFWNLNLMISKNKSVQIIERYVVAYPFIIRTWINNKCEYFSVNNREVVTVTSSFTFDGFLFLVAGDIYCVHKLVIVNNQFHYSITIYFWGKSGQRTGSLTYIINFNALCRWQYEINSVTSFSYKIFVWGGMFILLVNLNLLEMNSIFFFFNL